MITVALILFGLVLLINLVLKRFKNLSLQPPGPLGVPFFGYWPTYFGDKPYERFDSWAKKFGDFYTLRIGGNKYYVLNNFETIRQAFILDGKGNNFSIRPKVFSIFGFIFDFRAVGLTNGAKWVLHRKLLGSMMRRSDPRVDTATCQSADEIVRRIDSVCAEGPFDVYNILAEGVLNTVSMLVCGQRLMETDPDHAKDIIRDSRKLFQVSPAGDGFVNSLILRLLVNPFTKTYKTLQDLKSRQFKAMDVFIREHELTFDPANPRDYIDACFNEKLKSKSSKERAWLSDANLSVNVFNFFVAGVDTTASMLYAGLFLLANHPDVQEKCYEELISVMGENFNSSIKASDKSNFPYLAAVIDEISRYTLIAPTPFPRETAEKTSLFGYDIPAGSLIVANLWSATRDPKYFENPYEFDPNNFYKKNHPREMASLPFSLGKRGCPGESLAIAEAFVILLYIFYHFKFSHENGINTKENILPGIARCPAPFKLVFVKRN